MSNNSLQHGKLCDTIHSDTTSSYIPLDIDIKLRTNVSKVEAFELKLYILKKSVSQIKLETLREG